MCVRVCVCVCLYYYVLLTCLCTSNREALLTLTTGVSREENDLRDAAEYGRIDEVKKLIESGVNPNATDEV